MDNDTVSGVLHTCADGELTGMAEDYIAFLELDKLSALEIKLAVILINVSNSYRNDITYLGLVAAVYYLCVFINFHFLEAGSHVIKLHVSRS